MDDALLEFIHCHKCKKRTKNIEATKHQTNNGRWRISARYSKCKTNKIKRIKAPREEKIKIEIKKIKEKDKLPLVPELHKPVRIRFPKRRIITKGIDDLWACDLIIMNKYSSENEGYSYILNVIDTFSKFVWTLPLKKKDGKNVSKAFEKIMEKAKLQKHNAPK